MHHSAPHLLLLLCTVEGNGEEGGRTDWTDDTLTHATPEDDMNGGGQVAMVAMVVMVMVADHKYMTRSAGSMVKRCLAPLFLH